MKRQQETVGSIVQIHINDEFYVYAQILAQLHKSVAI